MSIRKQVSTGLATLGVLAASLLGATGAQAATAPPAVETEAATAITRTSATLHGAVNPEGTPVTACQFEVGPFEGFYTETVPCAQTLPLTGSSSVPVSAALTGLASGSVYYYRVSSTNENGTSEAPSAQSFATLPAVEGVSTAAATAVTSSGATLNGSLEPNGTETHYYFEYGITSEYGSSTSSADAGSQSGPTAVSTALAGLLPNQEYHFRLVAQNSFGATRGADEVFLTSAIAPMIESSGPPASVSRDSAVLAFTANAENSRTTYQVEYGPDTGYGARSAPIERSTSVAEVVEVALDDLAPGTVYHYRLLASNASGSVSGADETFTTAAATPPLVVTDGASGIGQNSATITASVNPQGLDTIYGFEVGTGEGYGLPTGLGTVSAGEESIALTLSGLQPGTTYHYRVLASNPDGIVYGADQTFTTAGLAVPLTVPSAPPLIATPKVTFPSVKTAAKPKAKAKAKRKPKQKRAKRRGRQGKRKSKGKR
jgi:phosphodiesterase/alkaline phosphatase D-like protein